MIVDFLDIDLNMIVVHYNFVEKEYIVVEYRLLEEYIQVEYM